MDNELNIAVFGGSGLVGATFLKLNRDNIYDNSHFILFSPKINEIDITNINQLNSFLKSRPFNLVINFAAITNINEAEKEKDNQDGLVYKVNVLGPKNLAEVCKDKGMHLIHISTGFVFDGEKRSAPYTEGDLPNPIGWYSQTKYLAEEEIKKSGCSFTIARIEMPYSAKYDLKKDIARNFLEQLHLGNEMTVVNDQFITPVLVDDVAKALALVIDKKIAGTLHITPPDYTTPFDFAKLIAKKFKYNENLVRPISFDEYNMRPGRAPRPRNTWLSSEKFRKIVGEGILHTIEESVEIFAKQISNI